MRSHPSVQGPTTRPPASARSAHCKGSAPRSHTCRREIHRLPSPPAATPEEAHPWARQGFLRGGGGPAAPPHRDAHPPTRYSETGPPPVSSSERLPARRRAPAAIRRKESLTDPASDQSAVERKTARLTPGRGGDVGGDGQVPQEGIEPPTLALGVPCSIRLSYWGAVSLYARLALCWWWRRWGPNAQPAGLPLGPGAGGRGANATRPTPCSHGEPSDWPIDHRTRRNLLWSDGSRILSRRRPHRFPAPSRP